MLNRRNLLSGLASAGALGLLQLPSHARVPTPIKPDEGPPLDGEDQFVNWMQANRGENPKYLAQRWDRLQALIQKKDVWGARNIRGFLLTPREEFVTSPNLERTYVWHYLDIGYGVSITGPHTVARMTSSLDVGPNDKVLEVGTGSGYQSAYLSNLTGNVFTVEIIAALAARTRHLYDTLIDAGYAEYKSIRTRVADGYYGWEEFAPFDKIIVTCAIDHVPPPLLRQLKPGGIMLIPVGPPGVQHLLKITPTKEADGSISLARSDIYNGGTISFVPLTGTHTKDGAKN
jgi:protein-L-isoaspartate(D-aspartate) O-methyltransferase